MGTIKQITGLRPCGAGLWRGGAGVLSAVVASAVLAGSALAGTPRADCAGGSSRHGGCALMSSRSVREHRHRFTTINGLNTVANLASTVATNKDANPYALAIAPAVFNGVLNGKRTALQPGDLLISDFSNSTGAKTGTSILLYRPSTGKIMPFYTEDIGAGPVAMAISALGATWIANYLPGYTNSADGTTTGDGNVVVITPNGTAFPSNTGIIDNDSGASFSPASNMFAGPWGQAFAVKSGTTTPYFFVTEVDNGTGWVQREEFTAPDFRQARVVTIGSLPVGANAFDPTGPQGMVYDPKRDILYVASTTTNSIVAFPHATTSGPWMTSGVVVYQGAPLKAPVGLTMNPINGDLIAANQLDNDIVEIAPEPYAEAGTYYFDAKPVGVRLVDRTPVNSAAGTGSALFGVVASETTHGDLLVYFVDSNTNSLDMLYHRSRGRSGTKTGAY